MKNKLICTTMLALGLTFTSGSSFAQTQSSSNKISSVYTDDQETILNFTRDGKKYKIKMEGKKVTDLVVDGNKVASEDYGKYKLIIDEVLEEAEKQRVEAKKMREEAAVQRKEAELFRAQAEVQRKEAAEQRKQADAQRKEAARQREEAAKMRKQVEAQRKDVEASRAQAEVQRKEAQKFRAQAEVQRKEAEIFRAKADVQRKEAEKQREIAEKERKEMEKMLDDLVSEKIVSATSEVKTVSLDDNELIVNGNKQSSQLHQQFKAKYLKGNKIKFEQKDGYRNFKID